MILFKIIGYVPIKLAKWLITKISWLIVPKWFKINSVKSECYEFYFAALDYLNGAIAVCSDGKDVFPQCIKNNKVGYLTVATAHQLALNELFDICGFMKYMSISDIIAGMASADKDIGCLKTLIKHVTVNVNAREPLALWNRSQLERGRPGVLSINDVITIIDRFNAINIRSDEDDDGPMYPKEALELFGLDK